MRESGAGLRWGALLPGTLLVVAAWAFLATLEGGARHGSFAAMWLAMSIAMMIPAVTRPMLRAADGSPARAWLFVAGFLSLWAVAGVPAYVLMQGITWTPFWIAVAWLVAGAYHVVPWRLRQLSACRTARYDGDAVGCGARQGARCVASCWPAMIAVMVTAMALPGPVLPLLALAVATAVLCWEKQPRTRPRAVAAVGLAMMLLAAGGYVLLGGSAPAHDHSMGVSTS